MSVSQRDCFAVRNKAKRNEKKKNKKWMKKNAGILLDTNRIVRHLPGDDVSG
jgi:hypothetical protein